jgi:hypothetical protein
LFGSIVIAGGDVHCATLLDPPVAAVGALEAAGAVGATGGAEVGATAGADWHAAAVTTNVIAITPMTARLPMRVDVQGLVTRPSVIDRLTDRLCSTGADGVNPADQALRGASAT